MLFLCITAVAGCGITNKNSAGTKTPEAAVEYSYKEVPLERNGIALHLDCMTSESTKANKNS